MPANEKHANFSKIQHSIMFLYFHSINPTMYPYDRSFLNLYMNLICLESCQVPFKL